ncbi:MAG TPA: M4 family metallopeptidase [Actinomycetota bacterium]
MGLPLAAAATNAAESSGARGESRRAVTARTSLQAVQRLRAQASGDVYVSIRKSTGVAGFIRVGRRGDLMPDSTAQTAVGKADAYVSAFGATFGIRDASQLQLRSRTVDRYGRTHLTYGQVYRGVPVFAGTLKVHLDARNRLTAVNGVFVPDVNISTAARLSATQAAQRAIAEVAADPPEGANVAASDLSAASTRLIVYRMGLIRDVPGVNHLAYEVEVTDGHSVRDIVFVHANAGKILNRYSTVDNALFRVLYEESANTTPIWEEGDAFPGALNEDQQNIVNFSGQSYYHFLNAFGMDSYDGLGSQMRSVNNDPTIACPNANWNGATTNYCNGVTSDDVVAHEWGHAYTQFTHNLIYQWQSGALNESYSDIWGETVDVINGEGTDTPNPLRPEGGCTSHSLLRNYVIINSPGSLAGFCNAGAAAFGPALDETGVTGDVVLADDGVAPTTNACEPIVNGAEIAGNIALVDRGVCGFTVKVKNAQDAGAIAVLVADNVWGPPDPLGGVDPTITIPSVRIALQNGNEIKAELPGVNVTMRLGLPSPEDNVRWLLSEDSTAFGGAIRDMWNPRCVNDPGRVTDAEYFCSTLDQGGVHTNSGVPNHGFALLVDGGTYNGHTIEPIGLVKAAHLYFQAQTVYQVETTDFPDHADALEASCTDLLGIDLEGLSTSSTPAGPSGEAITAADCAQVSSMIAAVELRTDPSDQCQFAPVLEPGEAPSCGEGDATVTFYEEDFEDGLDGWTLSNEGVFTGWPGLDWVQSTTLPGGRAGAAAFGADPDAGNCDLNGGDISGVMRMESPDIVVPDSSGALRLTFDHYIATELNFDGGNVKISINGGPFTHVPADAFTFNAYNATLQPTNPLEGEDGFSGTDGGVSGGSWGESQVDLSALGVASGDTVRLRFDMGMDGCTGIDGWYVDDVTLTQCVLSTAPEVDVVAGGTTGSDTVATMNLSVADAESDASELTLSASSSANNLVSTNGISFGGSGSDRTVTITANAKRSGTAVVTVTVTDPEGNTGSVDITVHVGTNKKDSLNGGSGPDLVFGRDGNDRIDTGGDEDLVSAGKGGDQVAGADGDDTLGGGPGNDVLTGGAGADHFDGGPGNDSVTDFNAGEGDTSTNVP